MNMTGVNINDAGKVSDWRNAIRGNFRTTGFCTIDKQEKFIEALDDNVHRYYSFCDNGELLAFGGLTYIQWENRIAEISLVVDPDLLRDGIGSDAVDMILEEGFNNLNLKTIFGECYKSNPAFDFWFRLTGKYEGYTAILKNRKFWKGDYYDSLYFSIDRETYTAIQRAGQKVQ